MKIFDHNHIPKRSARSSYTDPGVYANRVLITLIPKGVSKPRAGCCGLPPSNLDGIGVDGLKIEIGWVFVVVVA